MTRIALLLSGIAPLAFAVPAAAQSMDHSMHGSKPAAAPAPDVPVEVPMDHDSMQGMDMAPEAHKLLHDEVQGAFLLLLAAVSNSDHVLKQKRGRPMAVDVRHALPHDIRFFVALPPGRRIALYGWLEGCNSLQHLRRVSFGM